MSREIQIERKGGIDRRTVLKGTAAATGAGVVGLSGFTGTVGAKGHKGGSEPCEGCGGLLAKYEWDEEAGEFDFEKGRDSLAIDKDDFTFSNMDWKEEDNEILGFDWSSEYGIYDATCLTVKTGAGTFQKDGTWRNSGSFDVTEYDDEPPYQAVSYVALCIECAFWQVDFGTGTVPTLYTEGEEPRDTYGNSDERTLLAAATRGRYGRGCDYVETKTWDANPNVVVDDFEVNPGDQATVTFTVKETEHVHFGTWEMPGPFDKNEIPWGPRYDLIDEESLGPGSYNWTIDLPSV